ncbi:MAG TPA: VOC family protein [Rugosimonospora sp.]|nr:VOC family protein [Rugosimonospora sp.]
MHLRHLGLLVADQERSQRFYATYFAFDPATATRYPDGTVIIRDADGFDLALHQSPTPPGELPEFLHFGFRCTTPDEVHALHHRLLADGIPIVAADNDPDLISIKCLDPDRYPVEIYWEP